MSNKKNNNQITHVHDNFFRTVMTNQRVAREFLTVHLPEDLLQVIDLDNLVFQPRSYIDDVRKETIVDILYKTTIAKNEGYIYLLLEHQSTPDELMPFRLLKYTCNIIAQHLDNSDQNKIPLIYPMVIYHAKQPYDYSTDIKDLVDAPQELVDRYFLKPFHLIDLARIDDQELKNHAWAGAMEFALKHIFARDILPHLQDMAELLRRIDQSGGRDYISIVLQYILERAELANEQDFYNLINTKISPEVGENIMTLAEKLVQQGKFEGKREGRLEGRLEGKLERDYEIAQHLLAENVGFSFISKITGLSISKIEQLKSREEFTA